MRQLFYDLTINNILRMIAGKRYYGEGTEQDDVARRVSQLIDEIVYRAGAGNAADYLPILRWITDFEKGVKELASRVDEFLQSLVDEKRAVKEKGNTMMDHLLFLQETQPDYYTDVTLKGIIIVMILAGTETLAGTLEWAMLNLLNHQEVLEKARTEIDTKIGFDRLIDEADTKNLPYLQWIVLETLRLHPAAPTNVPHMTSDDCMLAGYDVPRGSMLLVNIWAMHRDPSIWEDPEMFKPERFENEKLNQKLLSFGIGRRACPGVGLAHRLLSLALGSMVQCFEWQRIGEEYVDTREELMAMMRPATPLLAMSMENFCFQNSVYLFVTIMVLVLLPRLTLSATSTYTRPEKFYVNCGSDSNVFYGGQTFVGDKNSSGNSVSFTNKGTEVIDDQSSVAPEIYRTVRIFRRPSSYEFKLDSLGLHFVRLHFSVVFSRADLLTARFTVSATSGSNHHLKSFPLQNFTETPRVEEFLLMMDSLEFEIRFVPDHSSLAFVNAIEVFSAPNDLEIQPDFDKNLHTIYRLNVGGEKITPDNDTLGRTWSPDDEDFLYRKDSARNINSTQTPNYNTAGSLSATEFTAPAFVYKTAKAMNRSSNERVGMLTNVTWSFKVKSNYKHFIRLHFSDILSNFSDSDSDFYLYVNGYWRVDVKPSEQPKLATPFFIDVVNVSDGSGLLNISIGTKEADKDAGFLNGLEMMEFLIKSGSDSSNRSSSRVHIIAGCVSAAASALVFSLLFMVFLKRRRSKKTKPDVEGTVWSPLPLHREKSDVYAFGVVLLEVLLARPALDCSLRYEEANLAEWAFFCKSEGKIDEILDPSLIGQIETNSLKKFMEIAEKCLKECGDERPSMADVIWDLEYVLQLQMMTIRTEAHEEDSTAIVSSGGSLVAPRLMVSDSFSMNSFVKKDDESKNRFGFTDSSETRVFSQLKISDAR
ncbi:unnamed protein product [Arabidopsis arenosa]|uniref:Malectin-like domain-containing protein n=1 Tax=Arabidopsis arenosa TaxID=38785 RepID=A0A8S2A7P9_ARAAE|nr:unnamed protein product [Arabidopsis arenosa]